MFVEALATYKSDAASLLLPPPAGSSLSLPKVTYTDTCRAIAAHLFKLTAAMLWSCMRTALAQVQMQEWLQVWVTAVAGDGGVGGSSGRSSGGGSGGSGKGSPRGPLGLDVAAIRKEVKQVSMVLHVFSLPCTCIA
jgi:hypothetical protein